MYRYLSSWKAQKSWKTKQEGKKNFFNLKKEKKWKNEREKERKPKPLREQNPKTITAIEKDKLLYNQNRVKL